MSSWIRCAKPFGSLGPPALHEMNGIKKLDCHNFLCHELFYLLHKAFFDLEEINLTFSLDNVSQQIIPAPISAQFVKEKKTILAKLKVLRLTGPWKTIAKFIDFFAHFRIPHVYITLQEEAFIWKQGTILCNQVAVYFPQSLLKFCVECKGKNLSLFSNRQQSASLRKQAEERVSRKKRSPYYRLKTKDLR